jgi:hypothetical protein
MPSGRVGTPQSRKTCPLVQLANTRTMPPGSAVATTGASTGEPVRARRRSSAARRATSTLTVLADRVRIGRRGDEVFPLIENYVNGRRTVELDARDGVFVVTSVTVELPGGPEVLRSHTYDGANLICSAPRFLGGFAAAQTHCDRANGAFSRTQIIDGRASWFCHTGA